MKYLAVGYHGTTVEAAAAIRDNGFDIELADENAYLGPGIYFWDNSEEKASHWMTNGPDACRKDDVEVLEAEIDITDFLDLTTQEGRTDYRRFIREFMEREEGRALREATELDDDPFFLDTLLQLADGELRGARAVIMRRKSGYNKRVDFLDERRQIRNFLDRSRVVTNMDIVICARDTATITIAEENDEETQ